MITPFKFTKPVMKTKHKVRAWEGLAGGKYHLIDTMILWNDFFKELMKQRIVACDTETTGFDFTTKKIIGLSFSWSAEHSYYVPIRHVTDEKQLDIVNIIDDLKTFFGDPNISTTWHNYKFDGHFLLTEGIQMQGIVYDTLLMAALVDENGSHKLKDLAKTVVHKDASKWEHLLDDYRGRFARDCKKAKDDRLPTKKADVHYGYIPIDMMVPYAASDTHYGYMVWKNLWPQITSSKDLTKLYIVETNLMKCLLDIEHEGVFIDKPYMEELGPELEKKYMVLDREIKEVLGDINTNSTKQMVEAFQSIGIKLTKMSKSGKNFSLDASVMEDLSKKYDICEKILKYRSLVKKKNTFVDSIIDKADSENRLHCNYNQMVRTGRIASSQPNLMNIDGKDTLIRSSFIPPKAVRCVGRLGKGECGYFGKHIIIPNRCPDCGGEVINEDEFILAYIDYSQMEVRFTGILSEDQILIDIYTKTFEDNHTRTLCEVFDYDYATVSAILANKEDPDFKEIKNLRGIAKMINFLVIYGGTAKTLAERISTPARSYSTKECQVFMDSYFEKYSGVRRWIANEKMYIRKHFKGQNVFGRWRRFPELEDLVRRNSRRERWKIERIERQWVNTLVQGGCADLFKIAMTRVYNFLKERETKTKIIMPIHDEIAFYLHRDEFSLLNDIKAKMEDFDFIIPMLVDISYSTTNWAEKNELKL
jgi:DNA polymerase-1